MPITIQCIVMGIGVPDLAPAESLAEQPDAEADCYEKQPQPDWRTPAKPAAPRPPVAR